jgi:peptidoglycan/LPS O-acetylase OafA/YrhL
MRNDSDLQYFSQLDGFRFFAILAVMLAHFFSTGILSRFPLGFGVLFFFVLSSFLITRILLTSKDKNERKSKTNLHSFKQFYIRRSLRIFPIYYLLLIFLYIMNLYPCRDIFPWLLSYTINLFISYSSDISVAGSFAHLWSLSIEEQFYLIFPVFIFSINTKYILKFLISITILGFFGRMILYVSNPSNIALWNFHSISALDSLGIGGILGYLSLYKISFLKKLIGNRLLFSISILGFLIFMIFSYSVYDSNLKYNFYSGVLMRFLFNILSFWILGWSIVFGYKGIFKLILENKIVLYFGKISYGLYLYHFFVQHIGNILFDKFNILFSVEYKALIFMVLSVVIASLSWYLIESPINKLKNNFAYN